jgi:DNA-binding MarR family transcriptional regulator
MRAWEALLFAHAALIETLGDELVRERDMPLTWYDVLIQLADHGGRMRMQDLARSILFSKSGLTRLIDRMERDGAVRRESCAEDGRGTLAVITPAGRRLLAKARPLHHRGIQEHFAQHLTDGEALALTSGLRKIAERLRPGIVWTTPAD